MPFKESSLAAIGRREQKSQSWMGWVVDGLDGRWWCKGVLAARKWGQITAPNGGLTVEQGSISALTDRWHHHEMGIPGWIRCEGNVGLGVSGALETPKWGFKRALDVEWGSQWPCFFLMSPPAFLPFLTESSGPKCSNRSTSPWTAAWPPSP